MYGQYNLDTVAQQVAARGGNVALFNQLMNDTANPSSLNWALQQATGGSVKAIEQLGPAPAPAPVPAPGGAVPASPVPAPAPRMYGQYNLDAVAQAVAAQGGDVNRFNQLMNDTSNPSSLNWALQQATGGKIQSAEQLGPLPQQAPVAPEPTFGITDPGYTAPGAGTRGVAMGIIDRGVPPPVPAAPQPGQVTAFGDNTIGPGESNAVPPAERIAALQQNQLLARFGMQPQQQLLPHQIDPARWDAMGQIGRDLTKNLAETNYGYDATDFERQVNATRPQGTAPRRTTYRRAAPTGLL
jgi:hypothetical protein